MLHLVQSNKMERLAERLVAALSDRRPNPMAPQQVLVQSPGMAQWLKLKIASALGIAANIEFPLPSSFIWRLYQDHLDDLPDTSAFTKDNMAWKLYRLVPRHLTMPEFESLAHYLDQGPQWQHSFKVFQLAEKIADIFDQYLVYRPDWIQHWQEGHVSFPDGSDNPQPWQALLWQALVADTQTLNESPYHRANLHQTLLTALTEPNKAPAGREAIHVFGLSALPVQQLQVLSALAQHQDVIIYWCNPSDGYWGDLVDRKSHSRLALRAVLDNASAYDQRLMELSDLGNPLLASWGKLGRDYLDMLLEQEPNTLDAFDAPSTATMLGQLQGEIFDLTQRGSQERLSPSELLGNGVNFPKHAVSSADKSLQLRACHSKTRELEVLKDQIFNRLDANPDWAASDIIVMMPDVASYAPYIDAVFGDPQSDSIAYAISDRSAPEESGLIQGFLTLMSLHQSRMGLTDVLDLLEIPAIARRFDIDDDGFAYLKTWLQQAGVRWSLTGADKSRWHLPQEPQNTLAFGLQRLLAGYALQGVDYMSAGATRITPYVELEGQQVQVLGQGFRFAEALQRLLNSCLRDDTLANKVEWAQRCMDEFLLPEEVDEPYLLALRQALEGLTAHQQQFTDAVNQDVFVYALQQAINEKGVGQRFLAGSLNFCTLMPMRSIPFKQVCLLGMNEGDYPRQVLPIGFDLMQHTPARRGDRSRRLDDRYLFLEAILSARDSVYLSYIGRSQQDNSERLPSLLVSELTDYCQHTFVLEADREQPAETARARLLNHIRRQESLQPFDNSYFASQPPESYQQQWLMVAKGQQQPVSANPFADFDRPLAPDGESEYEWDLDDWLWFWSNPIRHLLERRWHIRFEAVRQRHGDVEPLVMDDLSRYRFAEQLVDWHLADVAPADVLRDQWQGEGALPPGAAGAFSFEQVQGRSRNLLHTLAPYRGQTGAEIYIDQPSMALSGWLGGLYQSDGGQELLLWRPGRLRGQDRWRLWLMLLLANAQGAAAGGARFIGTKESFALAPVDQHRAVKLLSAIGEQTLNATNRPLLWLPECAWVWLTTGSESKVLDAFYGGRFHRGEVEDPYIQRVCPRLEEHMSRFHSVAQVLAGPLVAHANDQGGDT